MARAVEWMCLETALALGADVRLVAARQAEFEWRRSAHSPATR